MMEAAARRSGLWEKAREPLESIMTSDRQCCALDISACLLLSIGAL